MDGPSLRVLVVDDYPDTGESLGVLLRLWGHEVRTAADGPAALDAAREFRPDVVLLDVGLPGMSGWEVAPLLRGQAGDHLPLLIAVTGYGREQDRARSVRAGFD